MDLQEKYKKETGFAVGKIHDTGTTYYSDDYVKWLEKRLSVSGVIDYALECGNKNPSCAPNTKFGMLECTECDWGE